MIGVRLLPLLFAAGHHVAAMTRTPSKAESLPALGADPVIADVYDADALRRAVLDQHPDAIIEELTDLPDELDRVEQLGGRNARIRREGTRNLLAAAKDAGVSRFVVQSIAWKLEPPRQSAVDEMEQAVLAFGGVVLRYGQLYGPGTYFEQELPPPPRVHVGEAALRTVATLDAPSGVIEITDPATTH